MNQTELNKIIKEYKEWLKDPTKGKQADLSNVNLSGVNLSFANLNNITLFNTNFTNCKKGLL